MLNAHRVKMVILLALGCAGIPLPAHAQSRPPAPFSPAPAPAGALAASSPTPIAPRWQRSTESLVLGGVLGAGVGLAGGALAGAGLETAMGCGYEWCGMGGAILGAAIGEIVLLPLGVHLANGRSGNYGYALLASAGGAAGGVVLSLAAGLIAGDRGMEAALWVIPMAQLVSSIEIERRTSRVGS